MNDLTIRFRSLDQRDQQYIEECVTVMTSEGIDDERIETWIAGAVVELEQMSGTDRGMYDY